MAGYECKDGKKIQGAYFFHNQMWGHPNERDINKAKYLVADLMEDCFLTVHFRHLGQGGLPG